VIFDPARIPGGLNDSKSLSERRRDALETEIKAAALAWGVGFASVQEIDAMNILQATGLAMRRAVEALAIPPAFILVDGSWPFDLPAPVRPVVKGDSLSVSIAAASILAKTARDRVMVELDRDWPDYGFAAHKGYHAPRHVEALRRLGPCPAHRMTWAPIRALLDSKV
jgi:ribonuclease HII